MNTGQDAPVMELLTDQCHLSKLLGWSQLTIFDNKLVCCLLSIFVSANAIPPAASIASPYLPLDLAPQSPC